MPHQEQHATKKRNKITILQFYMYRLAVRDQFSPFTQKWENYFNSILLMDNVKAVDPSRYAIHRRYIAPATTLRPLKATIAPRLIAPRQKLRRI